MNRTSLKIIQAKQHNKDINFYEQIESPLRSPTNRRNRLILSSNINLQQVQFKEKSVLCMNRSDNHLEMLRRERRRKQDDQDNKVREEIWNQRQMDLRKNFSNVVFKKRSDFETMLTILLLLFLFLLALYLAPNQFYNANK